MSKKKSQNKVITEMKNQLFVQAERLGIREDYSPVFLAELKLDSLRKILTEFYMERSNLEYELNMAGSNKRELLIKLERLHMYIRKAETLRARQQDKLDALLEKSQGDIKMTRRAVRKMTPARVRVAA